VKPIIDEIRHLLTVGTYFTAVGSSLALPDICAALEHQDCTAKGSRYKEWWDRWLGPKYPYTTGNDIWSLRCGIVHNGSFGHERSQFDRVVFQLPNKIGFYMHNSIFKKPGGTNSSFLILNPVAFCNDILDAVSQWLDEKQNDPIVQANMPKVVQFRPNGWPACFTGVPVIA
jgi:hypothetical protein